jgi:hypothetical protein
VKTALVPQPAFDEGRWLRPAQDDFATYYGVEYDGHLGFGESTMRSALYFPHTEVQSEKLLRTSLLLWDTVEYIVPDPHYPPYYQDPSMTKAIELIGKAHYPDESEKQEAHNVIEEFATRSLPEPFYYMNLGASYEPYEIYPQKFMPETWELLRHVQLTSHPLANADYPLSSAAGLSLMSILADCCAGETHARITDQGLAYATLGNLLVDEKKPDDGSAYDRLVPISMRLLNIADIPLENLIAFREREQKESSGHTLTALRHNYVKQIETFAADIVKYNRERDRSERVRVFESDMQNDLKALSQELWRAKVDVALSKEAMVTVLATVTAAVAATVGAIHGLPLEIPTAASLSGVPITVGGGLSVANKFAASRQATMQKHPMAYLYELGHRAH